MSLVLLAHACSHLQNASAARLGLTSLPATYQLQNLLLSLQRSGYVSTVTIGGPTPPPPSALSPIFSASHFDPSRPSNPQPLITQENVASRRLWVGMKYFRNEPVLRKMHVVSKPTRRVWMPVHYLEELSRGNKKGLVKGLRAMGESMYVTTDRGIMELRECVTRKLGGMILCRVNSI